jgi:hypothetical protein
MFDGPQRAIRCAMAIRDAVRALGIQVRAGLHTGECEVRGDDIGGMDMHIGARVSALAGPNDSSRVGPENGGFPPSHLPKSLSGGQKGGGSLLGGAGPVRAMRASRFCRRSVATRWARSWVRVRRRLGIMALR